MEIMDTLQRGKNPQGFQMHKNDLCVIVAIATSYLVPISKLPLLYFL